VKSVPEYIFDTFTKRSWIKLESHIHQNYLLFCYIKYSPEVDYLKFRIMTLILAIIPVLLLIVLMAFFKMSGDKSSIISLIVTMLIALFGFAFSVDNLFYSFLYGALKAVSPILIIILMAIFSYNVLLKTEKMEIIKQQFASISTDKSIQVLLLTWGFGGLLEAMAGFGTAGGVSRGVPFRRRFLSVWDSSRYFRQLSV